MNARFFLDTNILIYTFAPEVPAKQHTASRLVEDALSTQRGIISFQVVQEFLNVASRKFKKPLSVNDCRKYFKHVLVSLWDVFPSTDLYERTMEVAERWEYSFYDSLIIAASLEAGCRVLYSEDLQHQQVIEDMTITNPFK